MQVRPGPGESWPQAAQRRIAQAIRDQGYEATEREEHARGGDVWVRNGDALYIVEVRTTDRAYGGFIFFETQRGLKSQRRLAERWQAKLRVVLAEFDRETGQVMCSATAGELFERLARQRERDYLAQSAARTKILRPVHAEELDPLEEWFPNVSADMPERTL